MAIKKARLLGGAAGPLSRVPTNRWKGTQRTPRTDEARLSFFLPRVDLSNFHFRWIDTLSFFRDFIAVQSAIHYQCPRLSHRA